MEDHHRLPLPATIDDGADHQHAGADPSGNPTPLTALRRHCVDCCGGSFVEVTNCGATACPLWPYRFGHKPSAALLAPVAAIKAHPEEGSINQGELAALPGPALKAIKRRCMDCSGNNAARVRDCPMTACDLHPFRLGKAPRQKRVMTDEQRHILRERLMGYRNRINSTPAKPHQDGP